MTSIITTDLHLTERPRDQYRFDLFPWLFNMIEASKARELFILGDMTDLKDRHCSELVNKIIDNLTMLLSSPRLDYIYILRGNHDCIDAKSPFFKFLNDIPRLTFITEPTYIDLGVDGAKDWDILFLPHSRDPLEDWKDIDFKVDTIFMHQTMNNAVASSGQELEGLKERIFKGSRAQIFSGDIHVPQTLGKVTYIGSPYHITFGDSFKPRVLVLYDDGQSKDLHFNTTSKHTITVTSPEDILSGDYNKGDQIKVVLKLKKSDIFEWEKYRSKTVQICKNLGLELCGLELEKVKRKSLSLKNGSGGYTSKTHHEIFNEFSQLHELDDYTHQAGKALLK